MQAATTTRLLLAAIKLAGMVYNCGKIHLLPYGALHMYYTFASLGLATSCQALHIAEAAQPYLKQRLLHAQARQLQGPGSDVHTSLQCMLSCRNAGFVDWRCDNDGCLS